MSRQDSTAKPISRPMENRPPSCPWIRYQPSRARAAAPDSRARTRYRRFPSAANREKCWTAQLRGVRASRGAQAESPWSRQAAAISRETVTRTEQARLRAARSTSRSRSSRMSPRS